MRSPSAGLGHRRCARLQSRGRDPGAHHRGLIAAHPSSAWAFRALVPLSTQGRRPPIAVTSQRRSANPIPIGAVASGPPPRWSRGRAPALGLAGLGPERLGRGELVAAIDQHPQRDAGMSCELMDTRSRQTAARTAEIRATREPADCPATASRRSPPVALPDSHHAASHRHLSAHFETTHRWPR